MNVHDKSRAWPIGDECEASPPSFHVKGSDRAQ
jgi:hypothetical protein